MEEANKMWGERPDLTKAAMRRAVMARLPFRTSSSVPRLILAKWTMVSDVATRSSSALSSANDAWSHGTAVSCMSPCSKHRRCQPRNPSAPVIPMRISAPPGKRRAGPTVQFALHLGQCRQLGNDLIDRQALRRGRGVVARHEDALVALRHVLLVVKVTVVHAHAEVVAHVFHPVQFGSRRQRLVQLLSMTGADDLNRNIRMEQFLESQCQVANGASRRLADEQIARPGVLHGKQDQPNSLIH